MDIIDMSQRFLFLSLASCYSGMELWRQLALKMKCLGEMQWKKQPGCENRACGFWEGWKLQQTLGVTP